MANYEKLLTVAKEYNENHAKARHNRSKWNDVKPTIKIALDGIANYLSSNVDFFKNKIEVVVRPESLIIHSGEIKTKYGNESGFEIHFSLSPAGNIVVMAYGHSIEDETPDSKVIAVIKNLDTLNTDTIIDYVVEAMEWAKVTCHVFLS